jgi:hypothetical protein
MSYCRVCGAEDVSTFYRNKQRQTLCDSCAGDTPPKVSRDEFEKAYWLADGGELPCYSVRKEFYEDYLRSTHTLEEYINRTTEVV